MLTGGPVRPPVVPHGEWEERWPGFVAGVAVGPVDYGLATGQRAWDVAARYEALAGSLGFGSVAVGRQVHGRDVATVGGRAEAGLRIVGESDGLASDVPGVLLAVTVADCVPVYLLDPESRAFALLHAGWRGAAAGILERGLASLARIRGTRPAGCAVHLGPAICGACYEVGPEVLARFGLPAKAKGRMDLRAWLAGEAIRLGVPADRISVSEHCTHCGDARLHSHRRSAGSAGRMAAYLGLRDA